MTKMIFPNCQSELRDFIKISSRDRHYLNAGGTRIRKSKRIVICNTCGEKLYWDGAKLK
mgnify:CR=1 FL=1